MKNEKDTAKFNKEFAAIRHGDYSEFLNLIGEEIEFIITYNNGAINSDANIREDDTDFGRLFKSGESLNTFLLKCTKEFGKITDEHLNDETFEKLALFELSLRMHRNNNASRIERISLENVIIDFKEIKRLSKQESDALHNGRKFLNCVKRPDKIKTTWKEGEIEFLEAYKILESLKLTII